ncbi:hypothetical protein BIT28_23150 [Photobacterium proteolyticum]|uniref:Integrin n=2 Tax=Photobacterium proteolyticum TaxID=1903952 RepID=A0A1Q9GLU9_9GAMM|nr:hypothetical protein BIT28_23150 [Photobacterium proteolyticum]
MDQSTYFAAIGYLKASNVDKNDNFGSAVSLSSSGDTLVVGAPRESSSYNGKESDNSISNSGAVYVFKQESSLWVQQARLKASNAEEGDNFGRSVSLSADGNTLAVGATGEDAGSNEGADGNSEPDSGAVYIFDLNGDIWTQQAYLKASNADSYDSFGEVVSLSSDGGILAIGAYGEDASTVGGESDNSSGNSGAVYIFVRNGASWSQEEYLKPSNADSTTSYSYQFGKAISLSSDGSVLAVGAPSEDSDRTGFTYSLSDSGAVYIFSRLENIWVQEAYLKASNAERSDYFGYSVSLNSDGSILAVGAVGEDASVTGGVNDNSEILSGSVYVFSNDSAGWAQQSYLKASNAEAWDNFGRSVSLNSDGRTLAVGASSESSSHLGGESDNSEVFSGAVYVFTYGDMGWEQSTYLKALEAKSFDRFGDAISLSSDGRTLAIGSHGESSSITDGAGGNSSPNSGAVYLY